MLDYTVIEFPTFLALQLAMGKRGFARLLLMHGGMRVCSPISTARLQTTHSPLVGCDTEVGDPCSNVLETGPGVFFHHFSGKYIHTHDIHTHCHIHVTIHTRDIIACK